MARQTSRRHFHNVPKNHKIAQIIARKKNFLRRQKKDSIRTICSGKNRLGSRLSGSAKNQHRADFAYARNVPENELLPRMPTISISLGELDGRAAIEAAHRNILETIYRGSHASFALGTIRLLRPDVTVAFARQQILALVRRMPAFSRRLNRHRDRELLQHDPRVFFAMRRQHSLRRELRNLAQPDESQR